MGETERAVTKRAGIVGLGTLASRILGLVRESVIAACFPKEAIDAYQVAFMIPNSFRRLTAEGSFSVSVTSLLRTSATEAEIVSAARTTITPIATSISISVKPPALPECNALSEARGLIVLSPQGCRG